MKDLIKKLVEAWGPSGHEHQVRALIRDEVEAYADDITVDPLGNLICRMGTLGDGGVRVLVAAHMDEIGVIVSHIDKQGFARVSSLGGVFPHTLYGGRAKFENGTIATIGVENAFTKFQSLPKLDGFYLDASTGEDELPIEVGDPAIFWRPMEERGHRLIAKSMDDRIGCAVAIDAMRQLKDIDHPNEVYFVFTVQEEVGLRGATTAGYGINPDFAIALDVTLTGDVPTVEQPMVKMGGGATIKIKDTRHIVPPQVKQLMIDAATENDIPYQREILTFGSTDAAAIQLAQTGVPSGAISIACRNVHTTSETVDIRDVEACVDLTVAILKRDDLTRVRPQ